MAILRIKDANGQWQELATVKGQDGITPDITIKTTTLPAGSTASVAKTGTTTNPVFTLGIPQGEKGDTPTDVVKSVNGQLPDETGSVEIDTTVTEEKVLSALGYTPLSTAGGTVTDTLTFSTPIVINQTTDTSHTTIRGGTSNSDGARLVLTGKGDSDEGQFKLYAHNGTDSLYLVGDPTGYLQWNGDNVVRSVNGTKANSDGNVTVDVALTKDKVTSALGYTPLQTAPVTSVNGQTGAVTVNVPVTSVMGMTGAVTGLVKSVNGTAADASGNVTLTKTDITDSLGYTPLQTAPVTSVNGKTGAVTLYSYGTADLTAGTSELATGTVYFMYE